MSTEQIDPDKYSTIFSITPHMRRDAYPALTDLVDNGTAKGKIIIITGGGTGIGAAAAQVWARAGAEAVVITGRRLEPLEESISKLKDINATTKYLAVKSDVSSESDVHSLFEKVISTFGRTADVVLSNAGYLGPEAPVGELKVDEFMKGFDIHVKGLFNIIHSYISTQSNPKEPTGTIIVVSSGRAAMVFPNGSSYNVSKLAQQRLVEHAQMEYPTLRIFTSMPGIALTSMSESDSQWTPYAKDHADLTGLQALWLTLPKADFLKGAMVGVNWDVDELVKAKEEIVEEKLLWTSWLPVIPLEGGKGLTL